MSTLRKKLKAELREIEWAALRPHFERDVVIVVSPELELVDVAEKVASNSQVEIAKWIQSGGISKPSIGELGAWEKNLDRRFIFLIIFPFVLIQAVSH